MAAASLPPAKPAYVLRGHASQVHAVRFSPLNHRILTSDADGWVVSWSLLSKRPVASWRAHTKAVLGLAWWGNEAIVTHGRDGKLRAWQLGPADEATLPKDLPLEHLNVVKSQSGTSVAGKPPILLETTVNTLNFCAFAACQLPQSPKRTPSSPDVDRPTLLLAMPHTLASEAVDLHALPGGARRATIPAPSLASPATGLIMALAFAGPDVLVAGYEGGQVLAYARAEAFPVLANGGPLPLADEKWRCIYRSRPHSQPVLSLASYPASAAAADTRLCISTAADTVVAKHRLPADVAPHQSDATAEAEASCAPADLSEVSPARLFRTGHSGQQGVRVRDDGHVFATAGWDGRVRVYAGASLREVAVLKWHKDGCYAVDFSNLQLSQTEAESRADAAGPLDQGQGGEAEEHSPGSGDGASAMVPAGVETVVRSESTLAARRREAIERSKHWLAAGSKDGKVSLWEVF